MLPTIASSAQHKVLRIARTEVPGSLTATAPETLVETLSSDLGQARAYSCGLVLTC
ncbi:type I-E CRISPR-associated protein Cas6/Cse3/CasE [Streptomyces sp. NPDC059999]|uniref:type I-E CRISPR-associated protein Cas6/Cse3/CasE n=1 Tax=Streptomyces sp. NPDC059999 TaxID=3347030 RepID=UPI0036BBA7CD